MHAPCSGRGKSPLSTCPWARWDRQLEVPLGTWPLLSWPLRAWQPPAPHSEPSHGCQLRRKREPVRRGSRGLSPQLCFLVPGLPLGSHSSICKMEAEPRTWEASLRSRSQAQPEELTRALFVVGGGLSGAETLPQLP